MKKTITIILVFISLVSFAQKRMQLNDGTKKLMYIDSIGNIIIYDTIGTIKKFVELSNKDRELKSDYYNMVEIAWYLKNILQYIDIEGNVIDRKKYLEAIKLYNLKYN